MQIQENVSLAPLTTFRIGGPARYFARAKSEDEVAQAVEFAHSHSLPLFVLGGGSNLLVADAGFSGLVLHVAITGITRQPASGTPVFDAGAGVEWDELVAAAVSANCSGIECLSGIPGTVGGTPAQNVGAYGQEVAETIVRVRALDRERGQICELANAQCGFRYRSSIFNTSARGRYVVLRVSFRLRPAGAPKLEYADLKKLFAGRTSVPSLSEVRQAVRQIRRGKGMLIVEGDSDCRSAGSFFKNPVITEDGYRVLSALPAALGQQPPRFPAGDGQWKLSAAWLVEHSGFPRGWRKGAVGISSKHALAIVNLGDASASDVMALKDEIQNRVEQSFGIRLQPEPVFLGF